MSTERNWFYTRYALTEGMQIVRGARTVDIGENAISIENRYFSLGWLGKDTFETREQAIGAAEQMRQRKIKSLQKSIAKLTLLTF